MEEKIHEYRGEDIDVTWDQYRCIHAAECVRGLPAVFDTDNRPWVDPDEADADAVADVITRCPTGALHFERHDGGPAETAPETNTVTLARDGPLYLHAAIELRDADGDPLLRDTRVALCRCGASGNKPLCDGSHANVGFTAPGTLEATGSTGGPENGSGELTVTASRNGPLLVDGPFELRGTNANATQRRSDAALCRCGASENKPFCDGSHASVGFSSDED